MNDNKTNSELDNLKSKRVLLKNELEKIYNKKWTNKQIILYALGLGVTVVVSGMFFSGEYALLRWIISLGYGIGVPVTAVSIDYNKEEKIMNEIKEIDKCILELVINSEQSESKDCVINEKIAVTDLSKEKNVSNSLIDNSNVVFDTELNNDSNTVGMAKKKVRKIQGIRQTNGRYYR